MLFPGVEVFYDKLGGTYPSSYHGGVRDERFHKSVSASAHYLVVFRLFRVSGGICSQVDYYSVIIKPVAEKRRASAHDHQHNVVYRIGNINLGGGNVHIGESLRTALRLIAEILHRDDVRQQLLQCFPLDEAVDVVHHNIRVGYLHRFSDYIKALVRAEYVVHQPHVVLEVAADLFIENLHKNTSVIAYTLIIDRGILKYSTFLRQMSENFP